MGGINSLSGLNNVNVDFRPAITTNVQKSGNANQLLPEANVAPEEAPQEMGKAKSVVRELDVLLLNAAGKSVSADAVENVRTVVESLVDMGVLTSKEKSQLQSLAENAQAKLKALDNDASFSENRIGLMKFAFDKEQTARYTEELKNVCQKIHGRGWKAEYNNRVSQDPAIVRNGDTMTIDLTKAQSHEAKMAVIQVLGLQSIALPEEIDQDFYEHLIALDEDPAKKQAYLDSIAPRISPAALRATEARLDEAIAHARKLATKGKVYGNAQWQNEENLKDMTGRKATVTITKTDGSKVKPDNNIECVNDYTERNCPSIFKREYLHQMFDKPEMAA